MIFKVVSYLPLPVLIVVRHPNRIRKDKRADDLTPLLIISALISELCKQR